MTRARRFWPALLCFAAIVTGRAQSSNSVPHGPAPATAQVFMVQNRSATDAFEPRPEIIQGMVNCAITNLTGRSTVPQAWLSLVSTQDVVGLKVFSEPGPNSGTRPAVVAAVIQGLLTAGLPPDHIIVWDKHQTDLRLAGFFDLARRFGVKVIGSAESGYDDHTFYDTPLLGSLVWGDLEFGSKDRIVGRKSFVSKLVSQQLTKIINITPLMNHNEAGVSGSLFSLALGSTDNIVRFESDPARLATSVPEIYALPSLSDHVVLNIVDGLICQYEGEERSLLHYSVALNQLRFSRDPVAIDVLSIQELERQRQQAKAPAIKVNWDLYHNASLLELGVSDVKKIRLTSLP